MNKKLYLYTNRRIYTFYLIAVASLDALISWFHIHKVHFLTIYCIVLTYSCNIWAQFLKHWHNTIINIIEALKFDFLGENKKIN